MSTQVIEKICLNNKERRKKRSSSVSQFLLKTYEILQNEKENSDIIRWSDDGKSFIILDKENFEDKVLSKYFKHSSQKSFVRQLHFYDFHKLNRDPLSQQYSHPYFNKGNRDKLCYIRRKYSDKNTNSIIPEESSQQQSKKQNNNKAFPKETPRKKQKVANFNEETQYNLASKLIDQNTDNSTSNADQNGSNNHTQFTSNNQQRTSSPKSSINKNDSQFEEKSDQNTSQEQQQIIQQSKREEEGMEDYNKRKNNIIVMPQIHYKTEDITQDISQNNNNKLENQKKIDENMNNLEYFNLNPFQLQQQLFYSQLNQQQQQQQQDSNNNSTTNSNNNIGGTTNNNNNTNNILLQNQQQQQQYQQLQSQLMLQQQYLPIFGALPQNIFFPAYPQMIVSGLCGQMAAARNPMIALDTSGQITQLNSAQNQPQAAIGAQFLNQLPFQLATQIQQSNGAQQIPTNPVLQQQNITTTQTEQLK